MDPLTERIIGAAIDVHRELGPGLLESAYKACLYFELTSRGMQVEQEVSLPVMYKQRRVECGYRMDLVVDRTVILELKSVSKLDRIHIAQMITYLKISGYHTGLIINFNVNVLKDGIERIVAGNRNSRAHN